MKDFLEGLVEPEVAQQILDRHQLALSGLRCDHALSMAVSQAGGRNETAIRALIDRDAILAADNMEEAARQAVAALKRDNGWLFALPQVSSPGTGALQVGGSYTMDQVGKMTMAEYRRYRQGN